METEYDKLIFIYVNDAEMYVTVNKFENKDELQYRKQFLKCRTKAECLRFMASLTGTELQLFDSRHDIIPMSENNRIYVKNIGIDSYNFKIKRDITTLLPQGHAIIHNMQCIGSFSSQHYKCGDNL